MKKLSLATVLATSICAYAASAATPAPLPVEEGAKVYRATPEESERCRAPGKPPARKCRKPAADRDLTTDLDHAGDQDHEQLSQATPSTR